MAEGFSVWDQLLAPTTQGILSAITGQPYPGAAGSRQQQETLQNFYAQGYLGEGDPSTVVTPRYGLGAMLQHIGILDEPSPEASTPIERYSYAQGKLEHQKAGLGLESAQFALTAAQQRRKEAQFGSEVAAEQAGAGLPESVYGQVPPDARTGLEAVGAKAVAKRIQAEADAELERKKTEAQIRALNAATSGGRGGKVTTPLDVAKELGRIPAIQANTKEYHDIMKEAYQATDPDERFKKAQLAAHYADQVGAIAQQHGLLEFGDPKAIDMVKHAVLGEVPVEPYSFAYGINPQRGQQYTEHPEQGQQFLLKRAQQQSKTGLMGALRGLGSEGFMPGGGAAMEYFGGPPQQQPGEEPAEPSYLMTPPWHGMQFPYPNLDVLTHGSTGRTY